MTTTSTAEEQALSRIVRYGDLKPCYNAFIDTRTPGSDQKENFTIIGSGVSENPEQYVHMVELHGFNIGGARQPGGCTNSQHSHNTVEVFYVHSGTWRFQLGEFGEDAHTTIYPGDLISIPTQLFRGFTNLSEERGFLWAVLGGDNPGKVFWAPEVFKMAEQYGLILLENGTLIDSAKGELVPAGKKPMPVTSQPQIQALKSLNNEQLETCVVRASRPKSVSGNESDSKLLSQGTFAQFDGVSEEIFIGEGNLNWPHGFRLSELSLQPNAQIPQHSLEVPDVYFVQSGQLSCELLGAKVTCYPGDTITFPRGSARIVSNDTEQPVQFVAVRGGDTEAQVTWL